MPSRQARSGNYAVYRSFSNKLAEAALLPVYLARRRRKVDAADADADEDNEEGEVLEADAESQKRRKTEDVVAAMNVAEDVRMESDGGAFLVGPCNGEDPDDGNEEYNDYNVEMMMEFMQNVSKVKKIIITTTMIQYQQKQLVSMAHHYICHVMTFKISILLI